MVDEGCHDLRDVATVAGYADAINIKLAKAGGVREAVRMAHAARALGLGIMIGCMVESQLAVAPAAHIASLAAWVDLDGHLLLAEQPFVGLELRGSRVLPRGRARARCGAGMSERLAIFAEGLFESHSGKTAHGVIRYGNRDVVAVVDSTNAGRTAAEIEPFCIRDVPMVATVREAIERGATTLLIGVAPTGGKLDPAWRPALLEAIEAGLDLEAGLHTELSADPELREAAERRGTRLRDLRAAPPDLTVPLGPASRAPGVRVVHSVGSDTVIGKKVVTLELDRAARERGLASVYVPTGQTGVAIAGWGLAVDHVISDYVAGAAERLVHEGSERGDLLFVEGQGAIFHPAYSGVTLGLLHGSAPDVLVLVHKAGATSLRNYPDLPLEPLPDLVSAYEALARPVRPARVAAVALNTARSTRRRPGGGSRGRAGTGLLGGRRGPLRRRPRAGGGAGALPHRLDMRACRRGHDLWPPVPVRK